MKRLWLFLGLTALAVAGAVWLADRPGEVTIHWQGWRVDTTVPVLLVFILAFMAVVSMVMRMARAVLGGPGRLLAGWRGRRKEDGYKALAHGMAALAAGEGKQAVKLARKADRLLKNPSLTGLLSTQAAQLVGDTGDLRPRYRTMSESPQTAFLGFKGLMELDLADGNRAGARNFAAQAFALNPKAPGLADTLAQLHLEAGDWTLALAVLDRAHGIDESRLARLRALAAFGRAGQTQALDDAITATKHDISLAPAVVLAARLHAAAGKQSKAEDLILKAFGRAPHPLLVDAWWDLGRGVSDLAQVKRMERLCQANRAASEGHVALARAALAARLWGQARSHLELAHSQRPTHHVLELQARLERDERKDEAAAAAWLAQAALAKPEPAWSCASCGHKTDRFAITCPDCGRAASLEWL